MKKQQRPRKDKDVQKDHTPKRHIVAPSLAPHKKKPKRTNNQEKVPIAVIMFLLSTFEVHLLI